MSYVKQVWADNDATTPLSAARLAHIEDGIAALDSVLNPPPSIEPTRLSGTGNEVMKGSAGTVTSIDLLKTDLANLAVGDLVIVNIGFQIAASTVPGYTAPSGYTHLGPDPLTTTRTSGMFAYPIPNAAALAAFPATSTFTTVNGAGRAALHAYRVINARLTSFPDAQTTWGIGSTTATIPALTTDENKCLILGHMLVAVGSPNAPTANPTIGLSGETHVVNSQPSTGTASSTALVTFSASMPTAGSTGTVTITPEVTAVGTYGYMVALAPAVPASSGTTPTAPVATVGYDALGIIAVDSYSGTDAERWDAVYAAGKAAAHSGGTYKRSIWFDARSYDIRASTTKDWYNGLRLMGPGAGVGREFRSTNRILTNPAGMFGIPNGSPRDIHIQGLSFENTGWHFQPFTTDANQGDIEDLTINDCGFQGGQVMRGTYTRMKLGFMYVNGQTGTAFDLGGTDSFLWTDGAYISTVNPGLPDTTPVLRIGMGMTKVGPAYVTAQGGYGLLVDYTKGGLVFNGTMFDSTLRSLIYATSLSADPGSAAMIKVKGSAQSITFNDVWTFNGNAKSLSLGNMYEFTGTGHDHTINSPFLFYQYDTQIADTVTGPAIYTSGSRITVTTPKWNIGTSGATRSMRSIGANLINLVGDHPAVPTTITTS
jgi:hypothetical protein